MATPPRPPRWRCATPSRTLHLPQVVSFTVPVDQASQRVMQRIGLTLRGEFDHPRFPKATGCAATCSMRPTRRTSAAAEMP